MSNLPVVHSTFGATGTVSWSDIGTKTVNFSVEVLARIAAAGVNPYTLLVGQTAMQSFRLSRQGRQNVQKALASLRGFRSWGDVLWLGFGVKSIVHDLGQTDEGCCLLAICGALSEAYREEYAAEVLQEMVQTLNPPGELTPSTQEWFRVAKTCAGIFSSSGFPVFLGHLSVVVQSSTMASRQSQHGTVPDPAELAPVLMALGRLSKKELDSIQIEGSEAGVWTVAVAHWFFGLRVVMTSDEGHVLYSTCARSEDPQVHYSLYTASSTFHTQLQIASKSYCLLGGWENLHSSTMQNTADTGRVPWQSSLSTTFGVNLEKLKRRPDLVGAAIGCLECLCRNIEHARTHRAAEVSCYRAWVKSINAVSCPFYAEFGGGMHMIGNQIINSMKMWFPELEVSSEAMKVSSSMSVRKAETLLSKICLDLDSPDDISSVRWKKSVRARCTVYCGSSILLFVVNLSLVLCTLDLPEDLLPTRRGLDMAYQVVHSNICSYGRSLQDFENMDWLHPIVTSSSAPERLKLAITLFSGRISADSTEGLTAASRGGICFYFGILKSLSLDSCAVGRLHITPGIIERDRKPYQDVIDLASSSTYPLKSMNKTARQPSLLVRETLNHLQVAYRLTYTDGSTQNIKCCAFINNLARARFTPGTYCEGRDCRNAFLEEMVNTQTMVQKLELPWSGAKDRLPDRKWHRRRQNPSLSSSKSTKSYHHEAVIEDDHRHDIIHDNEDHDGSDDGKDTGDQSNSPDDPEEELSESDAIRLRKRRRLGLEDMARLSIPDTQDTQPQDIWIYSGDELGSCGFLGAAGELDGHIMLTGASCVKCCLETLCCEEFRSFTSAVIVA